MTRQDAQVRPSSVARRLGPGLALSFLLTLILALSACRRAPDDTNHPQTAPAAITFAAAATPAAKPTGPLPDKASCITPECHATFKTANHIHGPIAAESCQSCHQPDQGGHKYPLLRTGNAMCTFCHAVAGTKSHQHKALEPTAAAAGGGCRACHEPHVSRTKFLLTADNVERLGAKCHSVPLKKFAHQPFAEGQCTLCHQPHQSDGKNLLRSADGPEHCYSCHADTRTTMSQSSHIHKPATQSCTTCHSPHATETARQLKQPVNDACLACHPKVKDQIAKAKHQHGALTQGNCASCHDAHASNQPADLKARTDKVCLTCHEKSLKTADGRTIAAMGAVLASKNLHGPAKSGDCGKCHLPHAADQPNLLTQSFPDTFYTKFDVDDYALCFSCHNPQMVLRPATTTLTQFRDGGKNLHFAHVNREDKGRTCKTCHDPHGSNLPNHMAASVPFEGSTWAMPIQYEPSSSGGTCTPGCHDPRTYDRTKTVTPSPDTAPATLPPATGGQP